VSVAHRSAFPWKSGPPLSPGRLTDGGAGRQPAPEGGEKRGGFFREFICKSPSVLLDSLLPFVYSLSPVGGMDMLTDYMVKCPHLGCNWSGSLLPKGNHEAWRAAVPTVRAVTFECPRCHREWHGQVIGDDVKPLPLEEVEVVLA